MMLQTAILVFIISHTLTSTNICDHAECTVGVTEKVPLPFCNYRSNGGEMVNCVLFAACRSNVERACRLNVLH